MSTTQTLWSRVLTLRRRNKRPLLSIIVVVYDMAREAPRTLHSLSAGYQHQATVEQYEVIVVDNGSPLPMPEEEVLRHGSNFRYFRLRDPPPSPAYAVNFGASRARAENVGILIDGARIMTPGVVHHALVALAAFPRPVVSTLAFHLGPDLQNRSIARGYDRRQEDQLLESIGWPTEGYRLFEIAALAGSSAGGWFRPLHESNCVFMPRAIYEELGGFDERFVAPGGGFVNLDFYLRACELPSSNLIMLLGEASFHQIHGGTMTNISSDKQMELVREYQREYRLLRGSDFRSPTKEAVYLGKVHGAAVRWIEHSCRIIL